MFVKTSIEHLPAPPRDWLCLECLTRLLALSSTVVRPHFAQHVAIGVWFICPRMINVSHMSTCNHAIVATKADPSSSSSTRSLRPQLRARQLNGSRPRPYCIVCYSC